MGCGGEETFSIKQPRLFQSKIEATVYLKHMIKAHNKRMHLHQLRYKSTVHTLNIFLKEVI